VALLAGGFITYQKLTAPPPPPPKKPRPVATPAPVETPPATGENPPVTAAAVPAEAKPAETKPAATPEPKEPEVAKPVAPPPPPPATVAFRGWVENLKIKSVRGGANPRVFIGSTSYQPGDLVNPQLGITFEAYAESTRMLTFRDKSGAKVERRW
jgi:hypothetical protein